MRTWIVVLLAALASVLPAQIFPKLKRAEIERKAGGSGVVEQPTPKQPDQPKTTDDPPAPGAFDSAAVFKRYRELADQFSSSKGRAAEHSDLKDTLKTVNPAVKEYFEGLGLMRMGFYEEAAKVFAKVAVDPRAEAVGRLGERIREMRGGSIYYYRMCCVVLAEYKLFDSQAEFDKAWTAAERAGEKIVKELESAIRARKVDETVGRFRMASMKEWLSRERDEWDKLWKAEKALATATDMRPWQEFLKLGTSAERLEMTPRVLDCRAALQAIKEVIPADVMTRDGHLDSGIATTYALAIQFDKALQAVEADQNLSQKGKETLRALRRKLTDEVESFRRDYR